VAEGVVTAGVRGAELDTAVSGRMWEQLLASEHGQVLPQALTEALLCAALPEAACCVLRCRLGTSATSPAAAAWTSCRQAVRAVDVAARQPVQWVWDDALLWGVRPAEALEAAHC
jgi:hypothetical protein